MLQLAEAEAELDAMTKDRDELQAVVDELEEKVICLVDTSVLCIYGACGQQPLCCWHHFGMILHTCLKQVSSNFRAASVCCPVIDIPSLGKTFCKT